MIGVAVAVTGCMVSGVSRGREVASPAEIGKSVAVFLLVVPTPSRVNARPRTPLTLLWSLGVIPPLDISCYTQGV